MINLSLAKLFVQVAQSGSIAAAARALDIAPSIANRQIALLERTLKTKLMIRTTRQLTLTEAGQALLDWAKSATESFDKLSDDIAAMQHRPSGMISVACNDYAAITYLPNIVQKFCAEYPDIRLRFSTSTQPVELLAGACDLVIHAGRMPAVNLVGRTIARYRRGLYASPAYLARKGTPEMVSDLKDHDCLAYSTVGGLNWAFERDGDIETQSIQAYIEVDNYFSLKRLAILGLGITRLTDLLVDQEIKSGELVEVLSNYRSVYADGELAAIWIGFPDRQVLQRTRLFADFLVEEFQRSGPRTASKPIDQDL